MASNMMVLSSSHHLSGRSSAPPAIHMMYHIVEFQERLGLHELTLDQNRDQFEREYRVKITPDMIKAAGPFSPPTQQELDEEESYYLHSASSHRWFSVSGLSGGSKSFSICVLVDPNSTRRLCISRKRANESSACAQHLQVPAIAGNGIMMADPSPSKTCIHVSTSCDSLQSTPQSDSWPHVLQIVSGVNVYLRQSPVGRLCRHRLIHADGDQHPAQFCRRQVGKRFQAVLIPVGIADVRHSLPTGLRNAVFHGCSPGDISKFGSSWADDVGFANYFFGTFKFNLALCHCRTYF
ncbi:hypothetical protein C8J57DRAFT_1230847 [Mycena rebaudengoi]|nr:hypothetical protein C8J57DRAFT_1230847 [Mycena rebaudengoi]